MTPWKKSRRGGWAGPRTSSVRPARAQPRPAARAACGSRTVRPGPAHCRSESYRGVAASPMAQSDGDHSEMPPTRLRSREHERTKGGEVRCGKSAAGNDSPNSGCARAPTSMLAPFFASRIGVDAIRPLWRRCAGAARLAVPRDRSVTAHRSPPSLWWRTSNQRSAVMSCHEDLEQQQELPALSEARSLFWAISQLTMKNTAEAARIRSYLFELHQLASRLHPHQWVARTRGEATMKHRAVREPVEVTQVERPVPTHQAIIRAVASSTAIDTERCVAHLERVLLAKLSRRRG